jgi:thioredoxin-related protein
LTIEKTLIPNETFPNEEVRLVMKKKINADKLLLGSKKAVLKSVADEKNKGESIETLISSIHAESKPGLPSEETKRTTIDIPKSLHKRINQRILGNVNK